MVALEATYRGFEAHIMTLAVKHYASLDELRPILAELQTLADLTSEPNVFFEPWNFAPAFENLAQNSLILCLVTYEGDTIIGFLPLTVQKNYAHLPLTFVKTWLHSHAFLGTPLIKSGSESLFWEALFVWLETTGLEHFPNASFLQLPLLPDGLVSDALIKSRFSSAGYAPVIYQRALLQSDLTFEDYTATHIRKKKTKEYNRLRNRLNELGNVSFEMLTSEEQLESWCTDFLALEQQSWKGRGNTAIADSSHETCYFLDTVKNAFKHQKLIFTRMTLNDKALAMLVTYVSGPGAFSYKISFDENHSRYSPGVMLKRHLTKIILSEPNIHFADSCAQENHPMIDHLWAERRVMRTWNIPIGGIQGKLALNAAKLLENASQKVKSLRLKPMITKR